MTDWERVTINLQPKRLERWERQKEEQGHTNMAAFVRDNTEAGLKKFERPVDPDENVADLREHRNDLKRELNRTRERMERLEERLYVTDQGAAARYLRENPDADYSEVLDHLKETAPKRLTRFLETVDSTGGSPEGVVAEAIEETVGETRVSMTDDARDIVEARLAEKLPDEEDHTDNPTDEQEGER